MSRTPTKLNPYLSRAYGRLPPLDRYSNYCLGFDGALAREISIPLSADFNMFNISHSLMLWFQPHDITTNFRILVHPRIGNTAGFAAFVHSNRVYAYVKKADATFVSLLSDALLPALVAYRWYCLILTHDLATTTYYLYLNGQLGDSEVNAKADYNANTGVQFGSDIHTHIDYLGLEDEIQILRGKYLNPQEVWEIFYRGYALPQAESVLNLRLDEGTGLTAYDTSGQGNHGNLIPVLTPPTWTEVTKHELLAEARI